MATGQNYVQLDVRFGTNRKLGRAGLEGLAVLLQLNVEARANPQAGHVSACRGSADQLALTMSAFSAITPESAQAALDALQREGLIKVLKDGRIYLPKWAEWGLPKEAPKTSTERTRAWRAKRKAEAAGKAKK
jgi:hypothetical protein